MATFLESAISFLSSILSPLFSPLLQYLSPPIPQTTLLLGLDSAGKSTLLSTLLLATHQHQPTLTPKQRTVKLGTTTFTIHDLGGHEAVRHVWADYMASHLSGQASSSAGPGGGSSEKSTSSTTSTTTSSSPSSASSVVFMIDSSTLSARLDEVLVELHSVVEVLVDSPSTATTTSTRCGIFFNKTDLCDVDCDRVFREKLEPVYELLEESEIKEHYRVFKGSAKNGNGVEEMFGWLANLTS
jgi:GTPase SAR1 family protein